MTPGIATSNSPDWKQWLAWNQQRLPAVLLDHLHWVSDRTDQFEETALLDVPPSMKLFLQMLEQRQKKQQMDATGTSSTSSDNSRQHRPTLLPMKRPLKAHVLRQILQQPPQDPPLTPDQVDWLCEALQGYHPGATKAPLENWFLDSFLSSCEQVVPGLFLGGAISASSLETLQTHGITHVVCVGGTALSGTNNHCNNNHPQDHNNGYQPPFPDACQYHVIDADDTQNQSDAQALAAGFVDACPFMDQAICHNGGAVLVHCMAGVSRSATAVCAYLMWKYPGMTTTQALQLVRSARPVATPNPAFWRQLEQWYKVCSSNQS